MKVTAVLFMLLFGAISMSAQSSLNGNWNTGQDNTKIEINSENGNYIGKIISFDNLNVKKGSLILKEVS